MIRSIAAQPVRAATTSAAIALASVARCRAERSSPSLLFDPSPFSGRIAAVRTAPSLPAQLPAEPQHRLGHLPATVRRVHRGVDEEFGTAEVERLIAYHPVEGPWQQLVVVAEGARSVGRQAGGGKKAVGGALYHPAADERGDHHDRRRCTGQPLPKHGKDRLDRDHRVGRPDHDQLRFGERLGCAGGRGWGCRAPLLVAQLDGARLVSLLDQVPLKRAAVYKGAVWPVGHRHHLRLEAKPAHQLGMRLALGQPFLHQPLALDAPGEVPVAKVEPNLHPQLPQALHHHEGVAGHAPTPRIDSIGKPKGHQVGIRGDVGAVDLHVIAGVCDHRQPLGFDHLKQAAGKLCSPRPSREQDDPAAVQAASHRSSGTRRSLIPAWVLCRAFTEISSAVKASVTLAISSFPQSMQRSPGILSRRSAARALSSRRSPQSRTSSSRSWSRSPSPRALTVCSAPTTATPSGTSSCACWAAEPCQTPSVLVAFPPAAAARGTVVSISSWPGRSAPLSPTSVCAWLLKGTQRITTSAWPAASALVAATNRPSGTSSAARLAVSAARSAEREPIATSTPARANRKVRPNPRSPEAPMIATARSLATGGQYMGSQRAAPWGKPLLWAPGSRLLPAAVEGKSWKGLPGKELW